jgi:hypothetical protein
MDGGVGCALHKSAYPVVAPFLSVHCELGLVNKFLLLWISLSNSNKLQRQPSVKTTMLEECSEPCASSQGASNSSGAAWMKRCQVHRRLQGTKGVLIKREQHVQRHGGVKCN